MLLSALAGAVACPTGGARAQGAVDAPLLVVGGPTDGPLAAWANAMAPALGRGLVPAAPLHVTYLGGADGVTGANQMETQGVPDGRSALLVPGAAALAWLVGDPRARFDVARWVPALAAIGTTVLCCRSSLVALRSGIEVRLAGGTIGGPDLPALLGLELLGARVTLVQVRPEQAIPAVRAGQSDAVLLSGRDLAKIPLLAQVGVRPVAVLGLMDERGAPTRDPSRPDLPSVAEIIGPSRSPLLPAWRATAVAVGLDALLALPAITAAAQVAQWRRAALAAGNGSELQAVALAQGSHILANPAAPAVAFAAAADSGSMLELRRWLAQRWNWRPA
jgi:ABC-type amino acid transport substrate-binding protein